MTPRPSKIEASHKSCTIYDYVRKLICKTNIRSLKHKQVHELIVTCKIDGNEFETTYYTSRVVESREWMNGTQGKSRSTYNPNNIRIIQTR